LIGVDETEVKDLVLDNYYKGNSMSKRKNIGMPIS